MYNYCQEFASEPVCWPTYPPYHTGQYFEQYFIDRFMRENPTTSRVFLPIHWTACYKQGLHHQISAALSKIPPGTRTFTVSTHDDAPHLTIPNNTAFSAGGLAGDTPIPLVCSPIPTHLRPKNKQKPIFCSFVGSLTHPIRAKMIETLKDLPEYDLFWGQWRETVSEANKLMFLDKMAQSEFSLCPRGYGTTSYRLYEALQLGSIPVYITDTFWLPFEDKINWAEFCILIPEHLVSQTDLVLKSIPEDMKDKMRERGKQIFENYFLFDKVYEEILERVK